MAEIVFTGRTNGCTYSCTPFITEIIWLKGLKTIALDTETSVTDSIIERQLKVISIADESGQKMWVIEFDYLSPVDKFQLFAELKKKLCIIQNVSFDYQVLKKYGCVIEKVYDTMLGEQVLTNGLSSEQGYHGLQAIYKRRFDIDISKEEQTSFGSEAPLSNKQIQYAAIDVYKLGTIRNLQSSEIMYEDKRINQASNKGLRKTLWWENEFSKVVGDMETTGVYIEKEPWFSIEDEVQPIWDVEKDNIDNIVVESFYDILEANDWISKEDRFITNIWSSSAKKQELLSEVFNFEINKTSQVELKKLLQENDPDFPPDLKLSGKAWESSNYPQEFNSVFALLKLLVLYSKNKDKVSSALNKFLLFNKKDFCIEKGWLIPANQLTLKWSSPIQRLKIFQAVNPKIQSTSKEILVDYVDEHAIFPHYLEWARVDFIKKAFGKSFYEKYVDLDGRFRTRFRQILATGRMSSVSPNLLAIPHDKVYRKCFTTSEEGEILIGADYDQEELLITGVLAKEESWIKAFEQGLDLHSINAEIIFKHEWWDTAEPDCSYMHGEVKKMRCKCPNHDKIRTATKTLEFGQIYGMGAASLAAKLKIPKATAQSLINSFFDGLPGIKSYMEKVKQFTVSNRFIIEPVFGRVRYFDKWKFSVEEELAGIERGAANFTIQSAGSAIIKVFAVLLRRWIIHHNLQKAIRILLLVHDKYLLCLNSFNCGKLSKIISTGKDKLLSLHDQYNGWSSNNLIIMRQSAAI